MEVPREVLRVHPTIVSSFGLCSRSVVNSVSYQCSLWRCFVKFYSRSNTYRASNCSLNAETLISTSYDWWIVSKKIGPFLLFNGYRYSPSTDKHQRKIDSQLSALGHEVDFTLEAPKGLQSLDSALVLYEERAVLLKRALLDSRLKKAKQEERGAALAQVLLLIDVVKQLQKLERCSDRAVKTKRAVVAKLKQLQKRLKKFGVYHSKWVAADLERLNRARRRREIEAKKAAALLEQQQQAPMLTVINGGMS